MTVGRLLAFAGKKHTSRLAAGLGLLAVAAVGGLPSALAAQSPDQAAAARAAECPSCAEWNAPQPPVRIFGNVYYVGSHGLAAILLTSPAGHILIDGGLPESAPLVLANLHALGVRVEDIRVLLNSHAHFDHAGGLAVLQRASGARVLATAPSAAVLRAGMSSGDDPQFGGVLPFPPVARVSVLGDGDTLRVGPLALVAHLTAGHTPGGTSWSWRACDDTGRCLDFVYADSQSPISANGFRFTHSDTYPAALADFARGAALLETLPCDVLLTPHPSASRMWERLGTPALVDRGACRRFAADARAAVATRVARERSAP
jgi:metallo-beta-lactamase class B